MVLRKVGLQTPKGRAGALILLLPLVGCGTTPAPTEPSNYTLSSLNLHSSVQVTCLPRALDANVYCTALKYPEDVTSLAAWSTSGDEFGLAPPLDPPVAVFTSPGVVTPFRQGNIYVRAQFGGDPTSPLKSSTAHTTRGRGP